MTIKSTNVEVHVEPDIKEKAETILENLGISPSAAINMFYRQVVLLNGIPFRHVIPTDGLIVCDEMSDAEFDMRMAIGLAQAKVDQEQSSSVDETFSRLIGEINR